MSGYILSYLMYSFLKNVIIIVLIFSRITDYGYLSYDFANCYTGKTATVNFRLNFKPTVF